MQRDNQSINVSVRHDERGYFVVVVRADGSVWDRATARWKTAEEAQDKAVELVQLLEDFGAASKNVGVN